MANLTNQVERLASGYLNHTGDPAPGQPLTSPSGSIVIPYDGQIGNLYAVTQYPPGAQVEATRLGDTTIGTLYGGVYGYYLHYLSSAGANIRGGILFWQDIVNGIVTPDVTLSTQGLIAGISLAVTVKGDYNFIQTQGLASVLFKSSITKATPAIGDLVIVDQGGGTPTARGDVLADVTGLTSLTAKSIIGVAYDLPVGGAVSRVLLRTGAWMV
jgi:hypothetical protein